MPINPYSPCPGGLGKKVKFCCADLISDLEKIERLREADQRAACLEYIEKLDAKHPGRACLVTAKADLLRDLGRTQEADAALKDLLQQSAGNPVALAEAALLACEQEDGLPAMSFLQQALRVRQDPIPDKLVEALRETGAMLVTQQEIVAGRQLLSIYSTLVPKDRHVQSALVELMRSDRIALLLKDLWTLEPAPADAPWKAQYGAAIEATQHIAWADAEERLAALTGSHPKVPLLWRSLAIVRSWLADHRGAAEAWHKYAALDVPLDDAVEAEATAQLLDPEAPDFVDLVHVEYQVHDLERILEVLPGSPRCVAMDISSVPVMEGEPPPKAVLLVLDRPRQAEDAPLDLDSSPRIIGRMLIFGRETDREPRLEVSAYRGAHLESCQALLSDLAFGMLGPAQETAVLESVPRAAVELEIRWFAHKPPPPDRIHELRVKHREDYLRNRWPKLLQDLLGRQSPEQAAAVPALRVPLLATVLRLETQLAQARVEFDFDDLRRHLNLPLPATLDPGSVNLERLPLVRLARIDLSKLDKAKLGFVLGRSTIHGAVTAARRGAEEALRRPAEERPAPEGVLLEILASTYEDTGRKLEYLEKASRALDAANMSSAGVDVQRLHLHLYRQEQQPVLELVIHLIDEHLNDREFGPVVIETLAGLGLVRPDGKILRPRLEAAPAILSPAGAAEPGKIWTPDSERAGGERPALWVPGS
jgi:hypothetical protein